MDIFRGLRNGGAGVALLSLVACASPKYHAPPKYSLQELAMNNITSEDGLCISNRTIAYGLSLGEFVVCDRDADQQVDLVLTDGALYTSPFCLEGTVARDAPASGCAYSKEQWSVYQTWFDRQREARNE